jgi:hypothetical protein
MSKRIFTAVLLALLGFAVGAQAQTYNIKIKEFPDKGKTVTTTSTQKSTEAVKVMVGGMVVKDETKKKSQEKNYVEEVLEKGARAPEKLKRTYTRAVEITDGNEKKLPYDGRTIIFEWKDGKYEARAEGEPAVPNDTLQKLAESATKEVTSSMTSTFIPDKAVKVGETWDVDIAKVAKGIGGALPIDLKQSTGTGKLVKVYQKDGHQFGTLELDLKLAVNSLGPMKLDKAIPFNMKLVADTAIDGSTTAGTMRMDGDLKGNVEIMQGGQTVTVILDITTEARQEQTAQK